MEGGPAQVKVDETNTIKIQCSDGSEVSVVRAVAEMSELIKGQLDEMDESETDIVISCPQVDAKTLEKVLVFCRHIKIEGAEAPVIEKPIRKEFNEVVDEWHFKYISWDQNDDLFSLIMAAHYLNIKALLNLAAGYAASLMQKQTVEQTRQWMNLENDFAPGEESDEVFKENKWAEEAI